jgi:hypothetical protein
MAQPQRQKSQQPQNLYGKAIKVTGNEAMFQMKMNVDQQGPRPLLITISMLLNPLVFSLYIYAPLRGFVYYANE